jgi:hypothetical protein
MRNQKTPTDTPPGRAPGRTCLAMAAALVCLFVLNVTTRMLFVKQGITIWRLNDVGEFLLVLVAMAFFVAGILASEKKP